MAKRPVTILREARRLLAGGWCRLHLRRRVKGQTQYCAQAAISMAATGRLWEFEPFMEPVYAILEPLALQADPEIGPDVACPLSLFNDKHTQAEVLALFDQAIQKAGDRREGHSEPGTTGLSD